MINDHKFVMRFIPKKAEQAAQTAQDLTAFLYNCSYNALTNN